MFFAEISIIYHEIFFVENIVPSKRIINFVEEWGTSVP